MAIELGPANGTLTIHTTRAGVAAKAGHDLDILVEGWNATFDPDAGSLILSADATSLRVLEGHGGVKALSDSDRTDIAKTIGEKVLKTGQYPDITFNSSAITGAESSGWQIDGQLTLHGQTKPVRITVTAAAAGEQTTLSGSVELVQSEYGIKPYSAMMGALKVADPLTIRAEVTVPSADLG